MKKCGFVIGMFLLVFFVFAALAAPAEADKKMSKKAGKLMVKALKAINQKQPDQAIDLLNQVLVLAPENAVVHHNLGVLYFEKGMADQAIGKFEEALRLQNDYQNAQLALRQTLFEAGKDASSKKNYEKANGYLLKLDSLSRPDGEDKSMLPYAQYLLGFNFFNLKQYQQAIDYFSKCQKNEGLEKENLALYGRATYFLGMASHILGQYDVSIDHFQKYLAAYAGSATQPEFLAQVNYFLGANLFRQLEEKLTKGDVSKMSESAQAILPYLNKAVEMKISTEDAYVMLGNCYVYIKDYDQAIKTYQQLCELFPQSLQLKNYQDFLQELQKMKQQDQKPKKKR